MFSIESISELFAVKDALRLHYDYVVEVEESDGEFEFYTSDTVADLITNIEHEIARQGY